ncbi:hypothetical protein C8J57DRAFT_1465984 [Mycena rebaudengoi]|nr:hypothetical protein C8J57DRAFT_1465984 [Mycena rebaudengoi]
MSATAFKLDGNLGLGITELGIFAGLIMFGILVLQVYMYFLCSADRATVKYLSFATAHAIYEWTVTMSDVKEKSGTVYGLGLGMKAGWLLSISLLFSDFYLMENNFIHPQYRLRHGRHLYVWMGILAILRKLYSNSLLASLNLRVSHRRLDANTLNSVGLFSYICAVVDASVSRVDEPSPEVFATCMATTSSPVSPGRENIAVPPFPASGNSTRSSGDSSGGSMSSSIGASPSRGWHVGIWTWKKSVESCYPNLQNFAA